ncbi:hypothetical protein [Actinomycetospora aeridis]|uniref:DUF4190 domain-containing protein n=1 Tax=Actinomycetospora aeridis TaxID=3129231 RepID=A0ABU8N394_9PSEU
MTYPYAPPPHQPYFPPTGPLQRSNSMATTGFVVALVGAVLSIIPLLGMVAWIVAPAGLVLSIIGLVRAGRLGGRGMAVAGVALGGLGLLICTIWVFGLAAASPPSSSFTSDQPYSYTAPSYSAPASPAAPTTSAMPSVNGPFDDGTYLVGEDIAPGTYRTDGASEDDLFQYCAAIRQDENGNGIGWPESTNTGPAFVTVRPSDGRVQFVGDCTWTRR